MTDTADTPYPGPPALDMPPARGRARAEKAKGEPPPVAFEFVVEPEPAPVWRSDVAAWTAGASLAAAAACVLGYEPLTGLPNLLGPAADALARDLCDAVGLGVAVLLGGGTALIVRYAGREAWPRLWGRAIGWAVVTVAAAAAADLALAVSETWPVSAFGRGGAVGAAVRFALADAMAPPAPALVLAGAAFGGLVLAAGGTIECVVKGSRRPTAWAAGCGWGCARATVRAAWRSVLATLRMAGRTAARLARRLKPKPRPTVDVVALAATPTPPAPTATEIPITRPVPPAPGPPARPAADPRPAVIPITRPVASISSPHPPVPPAPSAGYELPSLDLLTDPVSSPASDREQKLRERATLLEKTFVDFGLTVKVVGIHTGPVITQYEIALDTGLRLSKVTNLADDLALCLGVAAVRVVAPLPGRNTVGIEVPNDHRQIVRLKELIHATADKAAGFKLPIFVGKDVEGRPLVYDMADMPHLLIAGRTGTGKSVCINTIILSFLYTRGPEDCRLILIDPKKVELSEYGSVPHLMHPVVTDDKKAEAILAWAVEKMEERYELLRRARVRSLAAYNDLGWDELVRRVDPQSEDDRQALPRRLPYIVIVVDEVGDLLMSMKKEVEGHIIRLAQKSRAAGIHLILATQKPTVDVITGLIKSNLPARICFQVASRADSAVVLDEKGADKLLGRGDMLFLQPGTSTIIRAQGAYVDDREIERTVGALADYETNFEAELLNLKTKDAAEAGGSMGEKLRERDPIYEQAVEVVIREQRGSTSLLQRALGIGYGKASRFIDFMAEDGIVGAYNGSNARDVLVTAEEWSARRG